MIEQIIETEHKEECGDTVKLYGCVYSITYDETINMYIHRLKHSWRKN